MPKPLSSATYDPPLTPSRSAPFFDVRVVPPRSTSSRLEVRLMPAALPAADAPLHAAPVTQVGD